MKNRKKPLRRCVGCYEMKEKKSLIRITATTSGEGRGAYICRDEECLMKAKKSKGIERSFKRAVSTEIYEQLAQVVAQGAESAEQ